MNEYHRIACDLSVQSFLTRGSRLRNRSQILDELVLCHSDTSVTDEKKVVFLVQRDLDLELGRVSLAQDRGIRQGQEADLVHRITGIGDQLPEENILVAVKRVDQYILQVD